MSAKRFPTDSSFAVRLALRRCWGGLVVICLLTGFLGVQISRADALSDAKAKFDAGLYPDALRLILPALTAIPQNDDSGQRYELLMLRAECLLRIDQRMSAISTFDVASKSAPDARGAAIARANWLLAKSSPGNKYMPKGRGEGIDIMAFESRKRAFEALRSDLIAQVKPKYDAAMRGQTLVPMMNVLPSVLDVAYLELASTGAITQTSEDLKAMGSRARDMMSSEVRRLSRQINSMELAANSTDLGYTRRGLNSEERKAVQDVIDYAHQIEQTARDARHRATELGFDGQAWEPIIADSADLADHALALLNLAI
jgi:hypothetical protein